MMNRITSRSKWIGNEYPSLTGEGAGVVDEEGAAAEEPSEGDGPDQKTSGSCNKVQGYVRTTSQTFVFNSIQCINSGKYGNIGHTPSVP